MIHPRANVQVVVSQPNSIWSDQEKYEISDFDVADGDYLKNQTSLYLFVRQSYGSFVGPLQSCKKKLASFCSGFSFVASIALANPSTSCLRSRIAIYRLRSRRIAFDC